MYRFKIQSMRWRSWPGRASFATGEDFSNILDVQSPSSNQQQRPDYGADHMPQKAISCQFHDDQLSPFARLTPARRVKTAPHCRSSVSRPKCREIMLAFEQPYSLVHRRGVQLLGYM